MRRLTYCGKVSPRTDRLFQPVHLQSHIHLQPIPAGLYTGGGYGVRGFCEPCSPPVKNNATLRRRYAPALFLPSGLVSQKTPHRSRCLFSGRLCRPRKKEHPLPVCAPLFVGHPRFLFASAPLRLVLRNGSSHRKEAAAFALSFPSGSPAPQRSNAHPRPCIAPQGSPPFPLGIDF